MRKLPAASDSTKESIKRMCATWSSLAPGPQVWRLRCMEHRRGLMSSCSNQVGRAVRRERVRKSKTILASLLAYQDTSWPVAPTKLSSQTKDRLFGLRRGLEIAARLTPV